LDLNVNRPGYAAVMRKSVDHTPASYNRLARALHWTSAALVVLLAASGIAMRRELAPESWLARARAPLPLYDLHKMIGVFVLLLTVVRLANRVLRGTPPADATLPGWQRRIAEFVHGWIYLLLVLVPILGWVGISLYPALTLFGLVNLPALADPDRAASAGVLLAHVIVALPLLGLVGLHIAAALYHHFVRRDALLRRMLPSTVPDRDDIPAA
jgi:cytochrome b561